MKNRTGDPSFMLEHRFRVRGLADGCRVCGSPTHPATASDGFCGACVRSMLAGLREVAHPSRTCGGVRFYDHNQAPPEVRE